MSFTLPGIISPRGQAMEQRCQDVLEVSVSTEAFAIIAGVKWGFSLGRTLWNIWKLDENWAFQISPAGFVRKADVVEVSCLKPCGYDSIYKFKRGMAAAAWKVASKAQKGNLYWSPPLFSIGTKLLKSCIRLDYL